MNEEEIIKALRPLKDAPRVPSDRREAAYARVQEAWQAGLAEAPPAQAPAAEQVFLGTVRRRGLFAVAASVVMGLAVGLGLWSTRGTAPASIVARVTAVQGVSALKVGDALTVDSRIVTGEATVALALPSGLSVRLAPASESVFESAERLRLDRGRVYVDSGSGAAGDPWVVETGLGEVRHLGTQYLVTIGTDGLAVAVREGRIALQPARGGTAQTTAIAGERLRVAADAPGQILRTALSPTDAQWDWIESVPTSLEVEGLTLGEFLVWYRRETAQAVTLDGVDAATRLHGSIAGLTPDEALEAIAAATDLVVRRVEGQTVVRAR